MVLPLLAGIALRGIATRAVAGTAAEGLANSAVGRVGIQAAGQYGANALQRPKPQRQDHGLTQQIRQNPGEALATGALIMTRTNSISDNAADQTRGILQATQFGK